MGAANSGGTAAAVLAMIYAGAALAGETQLQYGPPPAWVKPATLPVTLAAPAPGAPVQPILVDGQSRLQPAGDVFYVEMASKILNSAGLAALGSIAQEWDPQTQSLTIHKLRILRDGKSIDALADQRFTVLRRENNLESAVLDGRLTAAIQLQGLQVGDIVDYAFSVTHRDPVLKGHSEGQYELPWAGLPASLRYLAAWPTAGAVRWSTTGKFSGVSPRKDGDWSELGVALERPQDLIAPLHAPLRYAAAGRLEFTSFKTWSEVSALAAPLFADASKLAPDSPLNAEIARIKAASPAPETRASLALQLVEQKVRYVLLAMNGGALIPAKADETWSRRFGDCKGKTALLLGLLSGLGVEAEPVLVNTTLGDGLDQRLPRLDLFDHVIVRARINGKTYWMDATRFTDGDLEALKRPNFGWVLPVRAAGAELEHIEPDNPILPASETVLSIDASAGRDAPAILRVDTYVHGEPAYAFNVAAGAQPREAVERALEQSASQTYSWMEAKGASWDYDAQHAIFHMAVTGAGKLDWQKDEVSGRPTFEIDESAFAAPEALKREKGEDPKAPFSLTFPAYDRNVATITLPDRNRADSYTVWGRYVDHAVQGVRYHRFVQIRDGVVYMLRSTRVQAPELSAEDAALDADLLKEFDKQPAYLQADAPPASETAPQTAPKTAATFAGQGDRLLSAGDLDGALKVYDAALALSPRHMPALVGRARVFAARNDMVGADREFARAVAASDPPALWVYQSWIGMLRRSGAAEQALAKCSEALARMPREPALLVARAELEAMLKQYGPALADAEKAVEVVKQPNTLRARAIARANTHDNEGAIADANTALDLDPDDAMSFLVRARIFVMAKQLDQARADLQEGDRIDPAFSESLLGDAEVARMLKKSDEALADYDLLLSRRPGDAIVLNARCWTRALSDVDLDKASADCDAALKADPKSPAFHDSLGLVRLRQGRLDGAIAEYDAALALAPKQAASLYGRGLAKLRKGDAAGGQADLAAAKALASDVQSEFEPWGLKP